jgi:hypothetical protein
MENDKIRSFEEEFWHQVNNDLCGGDFCINPDSYCDAFPRDVIERAAKRLFAIAEDPDIAPGVYDLDFLRERVAAHPKDYVTHEDFMRCEFYAEAGCQYNENGMPTCNEPITNMVWVKVQEDDGREWVADLYTCAAHAPEFAKENGFIKMVPLHQFAPEVL